jgi:hypothetical protein
MSALRERECWLHLLPCRRDPPQQKPRIPSSASSPVTTTTSHDTPVFHDATSTSTSHHVDTDGGLQSQLATDIEDTRQRLDGLNSHQQITSLGALASLSEACVAVWQDASALNRTGSGYFLFQDKAIAWTDSEESSSGF